MTGHAAAEPTRTFEEAIDAIARGPSGPRIGAFFELEGALLDGLVDEGLRGAAATVSAWAGRSEAEATERGRRIFRERLAPALFPEAWTLVRAHLRQGHRVVIVTSATQFHVAPVAEELGVADVVCTRARVVDGRLTGGLDGERVGGGAKAAAVRELAETCGIDLQRSHGYASGEEDVAFLTSVGYATTVDPAPVLAHVSAARGWTVLRFATRALTVVERARSCGAYAAMAVTFAGGLAYGLLGGDRQRAIDLVGSIGAELGLALGGIEVEVVRGERHLWARRPCVFVLNHQSQLDYFVLLKLVRERFTGVAKKEAAEVPGFGTFMKMTGMAFIDRSDTARAIEGMRPAVEKLREGISIGMSPEGTRSYSPRLGLFKKGAFHLAREAGVPIVPVVLRNAGELMTRDSLMMRPGRVEVLVLDPIDPSAWPADDLGERIEELRRRYLDILDHWPDGARPVGERNASAA